MNFFLESKKKRKEKSVSLGLCPHYFKLHVGLSALKSQFLTYVTLASYS